MKVKPAIKIKNIKRRVHSFFVQGLRLIGNEFFTNKYQEHPSITEKPPCLFDYPPTFGSP